LNPPEKLFFECPSDRKTKLNFSVGAYLMNTRSSLWSKLFQFSKSLNYYWPVFAITLIIFGVAALLSGYDLLNESPSFTAGNFILLLSLTLYSLDCIRALALVLDLKGSSGSAVKEALLKEFIFVMIALSFSEKFVEQKPFKKESRTVMKELYSALKDRESYLRAVPSEIVCLIFEDVYFELIKKGTVYSAYASVKLLRFFPDCVSTIEFTALKRCESSPFLSLLLGELVALFCSQPLLPPSPREHSGASPCIASTLSSLQASMLEELDAFIITEHTGDVKRKTYMLSVFASLLLPGHENSILNCSLLLSNFRGYQLELLTNNLEKQYAIQLGRLFRFFASYCGRELPYNFRELITVCEKLVAHEGLVLDSEESILLCSLFTETLLCIYSRADVFENCISPERLQAVFGSFIDVVCFFSKLKDASVAGFLFADNLRQMLTFLTKNNHFTPLFGSFNDMILRLGPILFCDIISLQYSAFLLLLPLMQQEAGKISSKHNNLNSAFPEEVFKGDYSLPVAESCVRDSLPPFLKEFITLLEQEGATLRHQGFILWWLLLIRFLKSIDHVSLRRSYIHCLQRKNCFLSVLENLVEHLPSLKEALKLQLLRPIDCKM
jgi:hypothetical protein